MGNAPRRDDGGRLPARTALKLAGEITDGGSVFWRLTSGNQTPGGGRVTDLSAELVQRLARYGAGENPVVSLFLNIDGRQKVRPEDYRLHLEAMLKDALEKSPAKSAQAVLTRISDFVTNEFERQNMRGLAIFGCGDELWEVVVLPVPVDDQLVVNRTPYIRPLETILDEYESVGVLLTDKQRARVLVIELGRIVERSEIFDPLPRHDDDKGDWRKDHVKAHSTVAAQHHFRNAAQAMFDLYQRRPFQHVLLCVAEESTPELERQLHAYLRNRVIGRCNLGVNATDDDVIATAFEFAQRAERKQESEFVSKLRAGVASNAAAGRTNGNSIGAVAGLEHTLNAVFEKRVDTLLVSEGYAAEGWRCTSCSYIATMGRKCRMCGSEMSLVEDVVEEAVEDALGQSCRVEFCSENADLDVLGRIGALLRF